MYMKIVIMNNSGNVGKSMVCDTFLKPRVPESETIKIETINSDGSLDETISAKDIKAVFEKIDAADVALIDVGASNIEAFMNNLNRLGDAHEDIDLFVIPTTPKHKQQIDTISTVENLLDLGVAPEKIKLVFNFYDNEYPVEQFYSVIFESHLLETLNLKTQRELVTISDNPVFDMLGEMGKTFTEIADDERDFKQLIREAEKPEQRALLSHQRSAKRLANGFIKELDLSFKKLNKIANITG